MRRFLADFGGGVEQSKETIASKFTKVASRGTTNQYLRDLENRELLYLYDAAEDDVYNDVHFRHETRAVDQRFNSMNVSDRLRHHELEYR